MSPFISTAVYRRLLGLLACSGLKLPDNAVLNLGGKTQEFTVLHRVMLDDYPPAPMGSLIQPTVTITSWAVIPNAELGVDETVTEIIDAEEDWHKNGHFWIGKIDQVYKDVYPISDKKLAGFAWCGNSERELAFPTFCMLGSGPLFTIQTTIASLELFQLPAKTTTKVGSIDDTATDPTFIPAVPVSALAPVGTNTPITEKNFSEESLSEITQKTGFATKLIDSLPFMGQRNLSTT